MVTRDESKIVWNVSDCDFKTIEDKSIPTDEQELHVNVCKWEDDIVWVVCSHTRWITKLSKNPSFNAITITRNKRGCILSVNGFLPKNMITLRRIKTKNTGKGIWRGNK